MPVKVGVTFAVFHLESDRLIRILKTFDRNQQLAGFRIHRRGDAPDALLAVLVGFNDAGCPHVRARRNLKCKKLGRGILHSIAHTGNRFGLFAILR